MAASGTTPHRGSGAALHPVAEHALVRADQAGGGRGGCGDSCFDDSRRVRGAGDETQGTGFARATQPRPASRTRFVWRQTLHRSWWDGCVGGNRGTRWPGAGEDQGAPQGGSIDGRCGLWCRFVVLRGLSAD
eukprot:1560975-Prymnesium_polylepis.1